MICLFSLFFYLDLGGIGTILRRKGGGVQNFVELYIPLARMGGDFDSLVVLISPSNWNVPSGNK